MPAYYWYECDSCDYAAFRYRNVRRCKCGGDLVRQLQITEAGLEGLGFHKIIWNNSILEYWLPLFEPTGDQAVDMDCRLAVRFNEFSDMLGPTVYLVLHGMMRLSHIKETDQLIQLYRSLTGRALAGVTDGPAEVTFEVAE